METVLECVCVDAWITAADRSAAALQQVAAGSSSATQRTRRGGNHHEPVSYRTGQRDSSGTDVSAAAPRATWVTRRLSSSPPQHAAAAPCWQAWPQRQQPSPAPQARSRPSRPAAAPQAPSMRAHLSSRLQPAHPGRRPMLPTVQRRQRSPCGTLQQRTTAASSRRRRIPASCCRSRQLSGFRRHRRGCVPGRLLCCPRNIDFTWWRSILTFCTPRS